MEQRRALARGLVIVGAATMVGNAAAYLLSMVAARQLTQREFGAFGALLGILVIIATLSMAVQAVTARRVSVAAAAGQSIDGQFIRLASIIGVSVILTGLVAAWPLGPLLSIPYAALAMGIASVGFVIMGTGALGVAQGREEHLRFSAGFIANNGARAVVGIAFVILWPTITGVAAGILVGTALGALIGYLIICRGSWAKTIAAGSTVEFGHIAHALLVLFTLTNVDILLARVFLSPESSGEYAVGVLLAKIAFFLPNAIIIVLFPKMTAGNSRRTVLLATGLTAMIGVVITVFSATFSDLIVRILGGQKYVGLGLGSDTWLFALEGSAFALVQVLLYARMAAQDRKAVISVWIALIVQVAIIVLWRHNSVMEIVTTVVGVSLVLTVAGLFLDTRKSQAPMDADEPVVPIEAAE